MISKKKMSFAPILSDKRMANNMNNKFNKSNSKTKNSYSNSNNTMKLNQLPPTFPYNSRLTMLLKQLQSPIILLP